MPVKKTLELFAVNGEEKNALHKHKFYELSLGRLQGPVAGPCSRGQRWLHSLSSSPLPMLDKLFHLAAPQFPHLEIRIVI